ncbi:hypothetical protein F5Y19DRAFT_371469 [Xylariaceae sp. FL1651]|nr:hypothetical protein F5Y19DRAFT_371469 [Xylariaceae sp. FL1651]
MMLGKYPILLGGLLLVGSSSSTPAAAAPAALPTALGSISDIVYCGGLHDPTIMTTGDPEQGLGFWITNMDDDPNVKYFLYENSRDEHPWKYLSIPQGGRAFVSVCNTWQGRVVRGLPSINTDNKAHNLGTWFKSSIGLDGIMWGDISFLEGCDGGGSVTATDGSNVTRECLQDMLTGAPSTALTTKDTGSRIISKLVGVRNNEPAKSWELSKCSGDAIWMDTGNSSPVINSSNGRLEFVFYKGRA